MKIVIWILAMATLFGLAWWGIIWWQGSSNLIDQEDQSSESVAKDSNTASASNLETDSVPSPPIKTEIIQAVTEADTEKTSSEEISEVSDNESKLMLASEDRLQIITIASLAVAFLSVWISFYLYRWRKTLLNNQKYLVPEQWAHSNERLEASFSALAQSMVTMGNRLDNSTQKIGDLRENFLSLNTALDEKDKELSRYRSGYDQYVFRNYILRFFRIYKRLDNLETKDSLETKDVKNLRLLFEDAIEESGLEIFYPNIGDHHQNILASIDIDDNREATDDPEQNGLICEVLAPGLCVTDSNPTNYIVKATVRIKQINIEE